MLCILSLFPPPTIHQSHNIPLPHFILWMHIFPYHFFSHILNLCWYLHFLSRCKITLISYMLYVHCLQLQCAVQLSKSLHGYANLVSYVSCYTGYKFHLQIFFFYIIFIIHSIWCVRIIYVYWNMHYVLTVWEILIIIIFVHPHNNISPITKVTGPWMYQNLIVSLISVNTATGS